MSTEQKHPAYGLWEVWDGHTPHVGWVPGPDPKRDEYLCYGTFEGYVDDLALQLISLARGRDPILYFRKVTTAVHSGEMPTSEKAEDADLLLLRIELEDATRIDELSAAVTPFFEGRPVVVDHHEYGIRLSYLGSEWGDAHLEAKQALDGVLAKLTEQDIEILVRQGLRRYGYSAAFPYY